MPRIYLITLICFLSIGSLIGQFTFDNCQYAKHLNVSGGYCSSNGEFTNIDATPDPVFTTTCVNILFDNGVWFSFIPEQAAVLIRVNCNGISGTMSNPKIILFDDCSSYIQCSPGKTASADEFVYENLIIGKTYYIMIESGIEGSFKLCIDGYTPVPSPQSDCKDGVILCDKSPFSVQNLTTGGSDNNEIDPSSCLGSETASSWYKWTCETSGSLTFTLTPNDFVSKNVISDDLDFSVYELPNGIDNCSGKILRRCMASGANGTGGVTNPLSDWIECNGKTGLRAGENDNVEDPGCGGNSNNFAAPLNMVAGKSYVLIVNNFSGGGQGFGIEFGGTGTFSGPIADFDILAITDFVCDKKIKFTDLSTSVADNIVSYTWGFGNGAMPLSSSSQGPIDVIYDSFGDKIVSLTIESESGCLVTKLLPIFVEPCCDDLTALEVDVTTTDLICAGIPEGTILGEGVNGSPPYMFSIDGSNYQTVPIFYNLDSGFHSLFIVDKKGCESEKQDYIDSPLPLIVDAGQNDTIDLGETIQLNASYTPLSSTVDIVWTPHVGFQDCENCLDPTVQPPGTTSYVIQITDENGCIDFDTVTIFTEIVRPVIAPNIIILDSSDGNGVFTISVGPAADYIKFIEIYDRWGSRVYNGRDIMIGSPYGWDGTFRGQNVNPAVFTWVAEVHFIDDVSLQYTGDLTVVR